MQHAERPSDSSLKPVSGPSSGSVCENTEPSLLPCVYCSLHFSAGLPARTLTSCGGAAAPDTCVSLWLPPHRAQTGAGVRSVFSLHVRSSHHLSWFRDHLSSMEFGGTASLENVQLLLTRPFVFLLSSFQDGSPSFWKQDSWGSSCALFGLCLDCPRGPPRPRSFCGAFGG